MPEFFILRAYLDTNVLFSASYKERNRFLQFWQMEGVISVTSQYAIGEMQSHLNRPGHARRLEALLAKTEIVPDITISLISHIKLVEKDKPILAASIGAKVDYLVTGDTNHFGHLYHTVVEGVYVISPTDFLDRYFVRLFE